MSEKENSGLVHKSFHKQVVETLNEKLEKSIKVVEQAKIYILSRKRKKNHSDDDMCFFMSASLEELKSGLVKTSFPKHESDSARMDRFALSITRTQFLNLHEEWNLYKEAHNGFDCYLAHALMVERGKSKSKKIADMGSLLETIMLMPSTPKSVVDEIESVFNGE